MSKGNDSVPKVSIVSVSYNQESYIREALNSFLAQQTDFEFEVVIADDCSTDSTPLIIREYAEAHPKLFKPILRKKNVGVAENFYGALREANGQYVAICEGDDYWTDPKKLQKQTDFLDKHPDYALCFHPVRVFFEGVKEKDYIYPANDESIDFTFDELLKRNYIQTNSVMYRKQSYESMPPNILPVDWYLHLYHAQFGKIGFIKDVMSAYRRHPGGVWWDSHGNRDRFWKKHGLVHLNLYNEILKLCGDSTRQKEFVNASIADTYNAFIEIAVKGETNLLEEALTQFPHMGQQFIVAQSLRFAEEQTKQHQQNEQAKVHIKYLETENQKLVMERQALLERLQVLEVQLNAIVTSKRYKAVSKAASMKQRVRSGFFHKKSPAE